MTQYVTLELSNENYGKLLETAIDNEEDVDLMADEMIRQQLQQEAYK